MKMGMTTMEFRLLQQMQKENRDKPKASLLDAARPQEFESRDQEQLMEETAQFAMSRPENADEAIANAAAAAPDQPSPEDQDFETFRQKVRNPERAFLRFLSVHPEYINCGENTQAMDGFIRTNYDNEVTAETLEAAFEALSGAGQLRVDPTKQAQVEDLDSLTAAQLYRKIQEAQAQAVKDEQEDRALFEKAKHRGTITFVRRHPEVIQCPENFSVFDSYFAAHSIYADRASADQFEAAYAVIKSQLKLNPSKVAKSEPTPEEIENMNLSTSELEKRAGGRVMDDPNSIASARRVE
jgi:hypothetical protein